jgi:hypothetical protein
MNDTQGDKSGSGKNQRRGRSRVSKLKKTGTKTNVNN